MNNKMSQLIDQPSYKELVEAIGKALNEGRNRAIQAVNATLVRTNWQIGHYIVEYEQKGRERAEYGAELLNRLSHDLTAAYGKGFSRSNIIYIRKFYLCFPKSETLSHLLSWSHYFEILKAEDELEIGFYTKQCEIENWSVRELKRQMKSGLFGGHTTEDMKKRIGIKSTRPLADFLPTLTIDAKNLATEMTNYNVSEKDLKGENSITTEHVQNNKAVREMLGKRGIKTRRIAICRRHKENETQGNKRGKEDRTID